MGFVEDCEAILEDGWKAIKADLQGIPYKREISLGIISRHIYRAKEDFTYKHIDEDINHGAYEFKKGETYNLRTGPNDPENMWFMPDRSKLDYIGIEIRDLDKELDSK